MKIVNDTPLPAFASPNFGPDDRAILTVVLRGTFDLVPGSTPNLAPAQASIAFADELVQTPLGPMPRLDSDLAPFKPRTDVLLLGRAYAPDGRPAPEFDVRLRVGRLQKIVRVFGKRTWEKAGVFGEPKISKPAPTSGCELSWAEAYGGIDAEYGGASMENPVGMGMINDQLKKKAIDGQPLPLLEYPDRLIETWTDRPPPASFCAVGRGWEPRLGHLGTYDEKWKETRAPLPPRDFSFEFHQAAPEDQQAPSYLRGDESFAIVNATEDGRLDGRLPGFEPFVSLRRTGSEADVAVVMNLDTIVFEPEVLKLQLVWRGTPPLRAIDDLDVAEVRFRLRYPS